MILSSKLFELIFSLLVIFTLVHKSLALLPENNLLHNCQDNNEMQMDWQINAALYNFLLKCPVTIA